MKNKAVFSLVLLLGSALSVRSQEPQMAPLNPQFEAYVASLNMCGNLLAAEQNDSRFGYRPSPFDLSHLSQSKSAVMSYSLAFPSSSYSSSYDLRTLNRATAVKDQMTNNTCWAYATFGSMESCLLPGETNDFSENNLANLAGFDLGFDDGGNALMSTAYFVRWNGPVKEISDPYPNAGGSSSLPPVKHIQQVRVIPARVSATDNNTIKQALMDYGGIFVSYYHHDNYYNSTQKSYYYNGSSEPNHAVTIVGWDDTFSRTRFNPVPAGDGAFIVKNSWGTDWGTNGYFYVSYYDTTFARLANEVGVFINAEPTNNYKAVYQYDPLGLVGTFGFSNTVAWGANIFTANSSDRLGAVGFYAPALNTAYEIYVYTGVTSGSPRSGTIAAIKTGTASDAGYYTIPLDTSAPLVSGQKFSIVLKLTTPGYNSPQAVEYSLANYSSKAIASPGQSYYSSAGNSWIDLTTWKPTANFCIKGYISADQALSDTDGDGIPSSWELQYFGGPTNANPNAICSNGINTVLQAYIAGLDPKDKNAKFGIVSDAKNRTLQWIAASGRVYSVYWTTNLMTGFQPLATNIPWTQNSFTNSAAPCGYYKIKVQLQN